MCRAAWICAERAKYVGARSLVSAVADLTRSLFLTAEENLEVFRLVDVTQLGKWIARGGRRRRLPLAPVFMGTIAKRKYPSQGAAQPDEAIDAHRGSECAFEPRDLALVDARIVGQLTLCLTRQVATALDVLAESEQRRVWLPAEAAGHRMAPAMRRRNEEASGRRHELPVVRRNVFGHVSRAAISV